MIVLVCIAFAANLQGLVRVQRSIEPNRAVAFDGERIMVTNGNGMVSLWKASSLTPLGNLNLGAGVFPNGVCSDGLHFWIVDSNVDVLLRF
jgi:hypothetical protein